MRIIVLFNLKPDVDTAVYETWAKEHDLPGVNAMPSVDDFNVYRVTGLLGSDAKPPYSYAEVLDVADMDGFWKDVATDSSQRVAREFRQFLAGEPVFLMTEELSETN